jgi:3-methylcrotonyl-CoA carboxylase alpha subunit
MIAKLITYGKDRDEAIDLMKKALTDYRVVGLNNNLKFLKRVISDDVFRKGEYDTGFIEQNIASLLKKQQKIDSFEVISAAIARNFHFSKTVQLPQDLLNYRNVKSVK